MIEINLLPMIEIFSAISIIYGLLTNDSKFMLLGIYIVLGIISGIAVHQRDRNAAINILNEALKAT